MPASPLARSVPRFRRGLLPVAAATAFGLLAWGAGAASGGSPSPAVGAGSSGMTLFELVAGSHDLVGGAVSATSDTTSGTGQSLVQIVPVQADGVATGARTTTPANSPQSVGPVDSPSALAGLVSFRSPSFGTSAGTTGGADSSAGSTDLGTLSALGLSVPLTGGIDNASAVSAASGASGAKTFTLRNFALPSIAAVLAAEGLDVSKLPTATLLSLIDQLHLQNTAITDAQAALAAASAALQAQLAAAQAAVASASAALTAAQAAVADKTAALAAAQATLAADQTAVTNATSALTAANATLSSATAAVQADFAAVPPLVLGTLPAGAASLTGYPLLTPTQQGAIETAVPGTAAAFSAYTAAVSAQATAAAQLASAQASAASAGTAVTAAQAALSAAQAALATASQDLAAAQAALAAALAAAPDASALVTALLNQLATTPLMSLDSLVVQTRASAVSADPGGQAAVVTGQVSGLHVLGTDVLGSALGTSTVNLTDLLGGSLPSVDTAVAGLTGTLSNVLSTVPGLPDLSVPAPGVSLLHSSTSTGSSGGFGTAALSLRALQVTLPSLTVPTAVQVPSAAGLPAVTGLPLASPLAVVPGAPLTTVPVTMTFGSVTEGARFQPAVAAATQTVPPAAGFPATLPGVPAAGPVAAVPVNAAPPAAAPPAAAPPAAAAAPPASGPVPGARPLPPTTAQLPRTGGSVPLALLALGALSAAWLVRRQRLAG